MQNIKIVRREWRWFDGGPESLSSYERLFCFTEDGSVYSCNRKFEDWKKEEPSNAELETSLSKSPMN